MLDYLSQPNFCACSCSYLTSQLCPCAKNGDFRCSWRLPCVRLQTTDFLAPTWHLPCEPTWPDFRAPSWRLPCAGETSKCVLNWAQLPMPDKRRLRAPDLAASTKKGVPKNWGDFNGCLYCKRASENDEHRWQNEKRRLPTKRAVCRTSTVPAYS